MEFDKSKVYTALNAGELQIGSKCIFADTIDELKSKLEYFESYIDTLEVVYNDNEAERFCCNNITYLLAYLIEPPAEPKYKPFESLNSLSNVVKRHGDNIQKKESKFLANIIGISLSNEIIINDLYGLCILPADELLNDYVFADDGSPCGELVEE
ncbi:hypothetical protein [Treponema denticola]|uniref:hypothetical protein n=1 Tax=Treponema denticola TaxID=158 RepID=UPI0020A4E459|nr:hypothetical protein [Treponema denticola]UTC93192.1 hypothetical protein E4N84_08820 [Treponema denticola]